ncbi:MAG: FtsX-like permease family protein [Bacillota bacterium]|nr:FtsX-like permease family protein [Bacillota bacterium]
MSKLVNYMSLSRFKKLPVNLFVGIRQVILKSKTWFIMFFVMLIATSMMLVPMNLLNTFKSPHFITYMGQSMNDIIISVSVSERLTEKYDEISAVLDGDADVSDYIVEARILYEAINKDGEWINVHIDSSNVAKRELQYLEGNVPMNESQIALSTMNANEMGVEVGDTLTMRINGEETSHIVSGIYQDVTSGGYTAKMVRAYDPGAVERYSFFINVNEDVDIAQKVDVYKDAIGIDVKVTDMEEFVEQTLGGVTNQLGKAVYAVAVMAMGLVALITIMFLKLQTVKEYSQIAIMKAIGFSVVDIRKQYLVKVSSVSLIGVIAGTLLANTLGEVMVSSLISIIGLGISKISFVINPFEAYLLYPLAILAIVLLVTWYCSGGFKKYNIIHLINE